MKSYFTVLCFLMLFVASTFTASFAQLPWTKDINNPVMSGEASGTWNRHVFIPMVLYNPDSTRYEMWFSASIGPPNWDPYHIGFATSNDGINWTKLDTAVLKPDPGTWDESSVIGALVIRENGQYKMWYTGWTPTSPDGIGYATSPDGITWTKYPGNPVMGPGPNDWEAGGTSYGTVMPVQGGGYKMWYTGSNANWTKSQIGYATSSDGITWTKADNVNPVLTTGSPDRWDDAQVLGSRVLFINNVYHMWYSGIRASDNPRQTGWATSDDGIHWNKYNDPNTTSTLYSDSDPVLKPSSGQWDGNYAQSVTVMREGDSLRMWYQGSRTPVGTYLWRIGHATAPININVPDDFTTIQAAIDAAHDGNVVLVDEGTYYENINFKGKAITVASHFYVDGDKSHISNTIIDGSQPANPDSGSVVYFVSGEDTNSVLSGFTITSGSGTKRYFESDVEWYGGGIYCASGGRIMNNIVRDNGFDVDVLYAAGGGISAGLWGMWGTEYVIIHDNTIVSNSIMGNSECDGGGIAFFRNGRITDNIINENSLTSDVNWGSGGGIAVGSLSENPNIVVDGNQIISNKITGIDGAYGGGIIIGYCDVPITNNIISGNIASLGGGICLNTSNSEIINNTIVNNTASYQGGGLYSTDSNPVVVNTIFWDNEATNGSQIYGSGDVLYSDIQGGWSGKGNIDFDPFFADTLFNLSETSPCVGNGKDSVEVNSTWYTCPSTDYYGNKRPDLGVDEFVDMGAVESPFPRVPLNISAKDLVIPAKFELKQNYPNPFNPITNIEYRIANSEFVTLKIYNLLGQEMVTLVSKKLNQGNHTYQFDGKNLASGIYYYQLVAGDYREVKKMILLR